MLDQQEFDEFRNILSSREEEGAGFEVNLEDTREMNLSKFNALVKLYVSLRRAGKYLHYNNFDESVKNFVDKTNFHHVFIK